MASTTSRSSEPLYLYDKGTDVRRYHNENVFDRSQTFISNSLFSICSESARNRRHLVSSHCLAERDYVFGTRGFFAAVSTSP